MTFWERRLGPVFLAILVAAVSVGCRGEMEGGQPTRRPIGETTGVVTTLDIDDFADPQRFADGQPPNAEQDPERSETSVEVPRTPIEQALGLTLDAVELSEQWRLAREGFARDLSRCLAEEGYSGYPEVVQPHPTPEELADPARAGGVLEFGYGVTLGLRAQLIGLTASAEESADPSDPGDAFVAQLPERDREPFVRLRALCRNTARTDNPLPADTVPMQIADEVSDLRAAAVSSPEVTTAWDLWRRCVRGEGYMVESREDAYESVAALGGDAQRAIETFGLENRTLTKDDEARISKLIDEVAMVERAMVAADEQCAAESDVFEVTQQAIFAAELAWLEDNGERVAVLLAESPR